MHVEEVFSWENLIANFTTVYVWVGKMDAFYMLPHVTPIPNYFSTQITQIWTIITPLYVLRDISSSFWKDELQSFILASMIYDRQTCGKLRSCWNWIICCTDDIHILHLLENVLTPNVSFHRKYL